MSQEKIKKLIDFNVVDCPVFINNSIFNDLLKCQTLNHIRKVAYAYCFYCLAVYLYKNAKYQKSLLKQPDIKEILGYSPDNRDLDFITKKNGLLDEIGYTQTITDFPVKIDTGKLIVFDMYRNVKNKIALDIDVPNNYKVKFPVKAFYKDEKSKEAALLNGSFYDATDCHVFDVENFLYCVSNKDIGCVGYFIISYNKLYGERIRTGPFANTKELLVKLQLNKKTLMKYLKSLAEYGILEVDFRHNQDVKEISLYLRNQLNEWRERCLTKYDNQCFITGSKDNLHIHHVHEPFGLIRDRVFAQGGIAYKPFNEYPKEELEFLRYRMNHVHQEIEGIPLRDDIHILLHHIYGNSPSLQNLIELKNSKNMLLNRGFYQKS